MTTAGNQAPRSLRWAAGTWSQVLLSQRVFWQDIAFAVVGALMPIAMGLAPSFAYRHVPGGASIVAHLLPGGVSAVLLWIVYTTINSAARRRENRVYKRLRATPLADSSILFGEAGSAALPALIQAAVVIVVGLAVLNVPTPRHPLLLLAGIGIAAAMYGLLSLGISGLLPSGEVATWIVTPFLFGLWYLSGAINPLSEFPHWLATVSHLLPTTAATDLMRGAWSGTFADHDSSPLVGGALGVVLSIAVMLGWCLVGARLWTRYFRWEPRADRT